MVFWGEIPPHVEWTAPKMNEGGVPTNVRVWIVGQTLYAGDLKASIEVEKGGTKVDARLERFPVEDISSVSRTPRKPGWTGASRVRYLFELVPEKPLKTRTWYKVTYSIWDRPETFRFETGGGPDETAPTVAAPTDLRRATEGLSFTLFGVGAAKDDHLFPVRLDYYVGDDEKSATRLGYSFRKAGGTGVLRGDVASCVFVRAVDLAGNASAMTPCVKMGAGAGAVAGTDAGADAGARTAKKGTSCACVVSDGVGSAGLLLVLAGGIFAVRFGKRTRKAQ